MLATCSAAEEYEQGDRVSVRIGSEFLVQMIGRYEDSGCRTRTRKEVPKIAPH